MATYFLMGVPFMILALLLDWFVLKTRVIKTRQCWIVMAVLVLMTAVFDQVLTGLPIVTYNEAMISGLKIGYAPIEDFMYTFAAVVGLGSLERHYGKRRG